MVEKSLPISFSLEILQDAKNKSTTVILGEESIGIHYPIFVTFLKV